MENKETIPQKIKCPECESIENAIVELTYPWATYVHTCSKCGHIIMESEWNKVKEGAATQQEVNERNEYLKELYDEVHNQLPQSENETIAEVALLDLYNAAIKGWSHKDIKYKPAR